MSKKIQVIPDDLPVSEKGTIKEEDSQEDSINMPNFNPCCCCTLREGAIAVGIWTIIFAILEVSIIGWQTSEVAAKRDRLRSVALPNWQPYQSYDTRYPGNYPRYGYGSPEEYTYTALFAVQIILLVAAFVLLCAGVGLIWGVHCHVKWLLTFWLGTMAFTVACMIAYCVIWWISRDGPKLEMTIMQAVFAVVNVYCMLAVFFTYMAIKKGVLKQPPPPSLIRRTKGRPIIVDYYGYPGEQSSGNQQYYYYQDGEQEQAPGYYYQHEMEPKTNIVYSTDATTQGYVNDVYTGSPQDTNATVQPEVRKPLDPYTAGLVDKYSMRTPPPGPDGKALPGEYYVPQEGEMTAIPYESGAGGYPTEPETDGDQPWGTQLAAEQSGEDVKPTESQFPQDTSGEGFIHGAFSQQVEPLPLGGNDAHLQGGRISTGSQTGKRRKQNKDRSGRSSKHSHRKDKSGSRQRGSDDSDDDIKQHTKQHSSDRHSHRSRASSYRHRHRHSRDEHRRSSSAGSRPRHHADRGGQQRHKFSSKERVEQTGARDEWENRGDVPIVTRPSSGEDGLLRGATDYTSAGTVQPQGPAAPTISMPQHLFFPFEPQGIGPTGQNTSAEPRKLMINSEIRITYPNRPRATAGGGPLFTTTVPAPPPP